jgi:hypothetical protein
MAIDHAGKLGLGKSKNIISVYADHQVGFRIFLNIHMFIMLILLHSSPGDTNEQTPAGSDIHWYREL